MTSLTLRGSILQPLERLLTGPGPSNPYPDVMEALSAPLVGHLHPYFLHIMDETMFNLRTVFDTENHHTIPMCVSGTVHIPVCCRARHLAS